PEPGYCAPTITRAGGVDQLLIWHSKAVVGLNPVTGEKYWSVPLAPNYGMAIMAPRRSGDLLFAGGIVGKAVAIKLAADKPDAEEVWRATGKDAVYPVNATPHIVDGVLYGVDQPGMLRAVEVATGKRLWATFKPVFGEEKDDDFRGGGSGTAFLVRNGGRFFLFTETGHLVIAKLSPEKYEEIDRAKLVEPTGEAFGRKVVWSHPAFADRAVFVRNDKEIACFSLAAE
ncbi:MAG: PQQ-binding-like beta-propeller repeat protein, partial [Fimbriiglobus sp.]